MKTNLISRITPRIILAGLTVSAIAVSSAALAQQPAPTDIPGHPRVNEVNQRLDNQQDRIQQGVADGQLNAKQATRDEAHDANVAQRESRDEAEHGGHLTKAEQNHLNKSLNKNSRRIHKQRTQ
jgi:hypothetical protein